MFNAAEGKTDGNRLRHVAGFVIICPGRDWRRPVGWPYFLKTSVLWSRLPFCRYYSCFESGGAFLCQLRVPYLDRGTPVQKTYPLPSPLKRLKKDETLYLSKYSLVDEEPGLILPGALTRLKKPGKVSHSLLPLQSKHTSCRHIILY